MGKRQKSKDGPKTTGEHRGCMRKVRKGKPSQKL